VADRVQRSHSAALQARPIQQIDAGEPVAGVAAELGVARRAQYERRAEYRALGAAGLNRKRGPKPGGIARSIAEVVRPNPSTNDEA
jgi:hypothetical protein